MFYWDYLFQIPTGLDNVGKATKKKLTQYKNQFTFQNTFARYVLDALGRYKLNNLPETMSERVILQSLLWYGCVCLFEKDGALLSLPCAPASSGFNIYGDWGNARVFSLNGKLNEETRLFIDGGDETAFLRDTNGMLRGDAKGVMLRENPLLYPFIRVVLQFAEATSDTYRTLDTVRANIKRPFMVFAEESVVPSVKKYFEQRDMNYDEIISTGVFDPSKVVTQPIDVNGTSLADATQLIEWYDNKFRELCGIQNNGQMDKKGENLIKEEVTVNDYYTTWQVNRCVESINHYLEQFNKMFGTNIECEVRENENFFGDSESDNISNGDSRDTTGDNL